MTPEEYKQDLIDQFRSEATSAVEITKERFDLCFPDHEALAVFLKTNNLHLHTHPQWGQTITISVDEINPWG